MKELFFIIKDLLKGLETFKYIDLDYGQGDIANPPLRYPAALINIILPDCQDITGQDQRVRALISVRMFWNFTQDTSSMFSDDKISSALNYFDTVEAVHGVLQHHSDGQIEPLSRKSLIPEKRGDGLKVVNIPYETYFDDVVE